MKKVRFAFYLAKVDGHVLDNAIALYTGLFNWGCPAVSHVETWWPNEDGVFQEIEPHVSDKFVDQCYTSTMRGEDNGTVLRPAAEVIQNVQRWIYFEADVTNDAYKEARNWAEYYVSRNEGYDMLTIASFFWFVRLGQDDRAICSERTYQFAWDCGLFPKRRREACPSPRRLYRWFVQIGLKPIRLSGGGHNG